MQRAYLCKKLYQMLQSRHPGERQSLAEAVVNYINRRKLSNSSVEVIAKDRVITKIENFATSPSEQARNDIQNLIKYLQEGI